MRNLFAPISFRASAKAALSLLFLAGMSGCGTPIDEEQLPQVELAHLEQAIENGEVYPSELNAGTVYVRIEWADGQKPTPRDNPVPDAQRCSGQVISRDTILLAAHCFYEFGYYADGWSSSVPVQASVLHQEPNGTWEWISGSDEWMTVNVPFPYVYYEKSTLSDKHKLKIQYDVAVLRRSSNWDNTVSTDVTALATDRWDEPSWLYLYGHGYYSDTQVDYKLRRGFFQPLTFHNDSSNSYFGSIEYDPIAGSAYSCTGDSGGPWKVPQWGTTVSGVQFGVHSGGINSAGGTCTEDGSRAAMVPRNTQWINGEVNAGAGSCSVTSHWIRANPSLSWTLVDTLTCW